MSTTSYPDKDARVVWFRRLQSNTSAMLGSLAEAASLARDWVVNEYGMTADEKALDYATDLPDVVKDRICTPELIGQETPGNMASLEDVEIFITEIVPALDTFANTVASNGQNYGDIIRRLRRQ